MSNTQYDVFNFLDTAYNFFNQYSEIATYGKIWDNEDVQGLGSIETEFPAIVFNDTLTSEVTLSCEPTVSSLNNNEINFRISFEESDDEDCTVKMDDPSITIEEYIRLEQEKARRSIETEFPAIVYNDALTSEVAVSYEPTICRYGVLLNEYSIFDCNKRDLIRSMISLEVFDHLILSVFVFSDEYSIRSRLVIMERNGVFLEGYWRVSMAWARGNHRGF
nr:hypothetical protein [Tanacetum cinerariifolium]